MRSTRQKPGPTATILCTVHTVTSPSCGFTITCIIWYNSSTAVLLCCTRCSIHGRESMIACKLSAAMMAKDFREHGSQHDGHPAASLCNPQPHASTRSPSEKAIVMMLDCLLCPRINHGFSYAVLVPAGTIVYYHTVSYRTRICVRT